MDTKKNITDKQLALDKRYIRMAQIWAENSYCQRRKVGALIVKDKMVSVVSYSRSTTGSKTVSNFCKKPAYKWISLIRKPMNL